MPLAAGQDVDQAWDDYLASHVAPAADLRETVRRQMGRQKFTDVVAIIRAALRNRQGQPWMFEAMALAMFANNDEPEQIERTIMSAADFSTSPADLMYLAHYLLQSTSYFDGDAQNRFRRRALKLAQQVARMAPTSPEPLVLGLKAAKDIDDVEGIKWAVVGIVSQAWPKETGEIFRNGYREGKATYERLLKEKRVKEAEDFEAAVSKALQRDLIVEVIWSGDADIDIMVEEPAGTICSFRNPRTTSGGIMMGDAVSVSAKKIEGVTRETYVCPQAFDGRYRVRLRRVWGKPSAGKVTIKTYSKFNTKDVKTFSRTIALGDEDAVALVDLEGGRRKQALQEHQVVNALAQVANGQQMIARQIQALGNNQASLGFLAARQRAAAGGFGPLALRRAAVGYQPVIAVLPEGARMYATAVISADRRYVRVTSTPNFSGIGEVNTFSTSTGSGGLQQNGQGQVQGQGQGGQGFAGQGFGQGNGNAFGGGGGGGGGLGGAVVVGLAAAASAAAAVSSQRAFANENDEMPNRIAFTPWRIASPGCFFCAVRRARRRCMRRRPSHRPTGQPIARPRFKCSELQRTISASNIWIAMSERTTAGAYTPLSGCCSAAESRAWRRSLRSGSAAAYNEGSRPLAGQIPPNEFPPLCAEEENRYR